MTAPLRIALLAHSTNPRGGVVHALELGDALVRLGHDAVVHAPDATGAGFFRRPSCTTIAVPATQMEAADTHALVETRVADYLRYFADPARRRFDLFHAQDSISANALATLKEHGLIDGFARTVHHIDAFADPRLAALQRRAIVSADVHIAVSRPWQAALHAEFRVEATLVGNGVDLRRYARRPQPDDLILRRRLGLQAGPVFLSVGGVEARKNTLGILDAFIQVHRVRPGAQLVIAGGSSLLDHGAYQARFAEALSASGLPAHAVLRLGPMADAEMPALYRNADALVFPSLKEGFGLVVLEAMACGIPVVAPLMPPFTDYLGDNDVVWCTPENAASIADAMLLTLLPPLRVALLARGAAVASRHDWLDTARAHLPAYERLGALQHA